MIERNFCKSVISNGGKLVPLIINPQDSSGLGLMNPTILVEDSRILVNIRNVNYSLYHCEGNQLINSRWGPLTYLHPENDQHLRTHNFMCILDPSTLDIKEYSLTDTSYIDVKPLWEFVGLEDVRLMRWNNTLYQCGVRRDTTPNGIGRIEMTELIEETKAGKTIFKEVSRGRISPPGDETYCEKNWMPVSDMPYTFVKWTNPTEVVKVDRTNYVSTGKYEASSKSIHKSTSIIPDVADFRGGSQVIPWEDKYIALIHETFLFKNILVQKDAIYKHRFVIWDKNWNLLKMSDSFSFMDGDIEFACGMAFHDNSFLITFGFQDNAAFLLKVPELVVKNMLKPISSADKRVIVNIPKNDKPLIEANVVDFFPFYAPYGKEMLELRYNMLKDHVDYFIVAELDKSHTGIPVEFEARKLLKKLGIPEEKFLILEIKIPEAEELILDEIDYLNTYKENKNNIDAVRARCRERIQKDALLLLSEQFSDNTVFIHSDLDEIINPDYINWFTDTVRKTPNKIIKVPLVYLQGKATLRTHYRETGEPAPWNGSMFLCNKQHLRNSTPVSIRSGQFATYPIIFHTLNNKIVEDCGWHFSWMGNLKERKSKQESYIHSKDKIDFVLGGGYDTSEINNLLAKNSVENDLPPSGELDKILKPYDINLLPSEIFQSKRIQRFLGLTKNETYNRIHTKSIYKIQNDLEGYCSVVKALSLINLVKEFQCKNIIEIGVFGGSSLIPMGLAIKKYFKNGIIHAIDPWDTKESVAYHKDNSHIKYWREVDHEKIYAGFINAIEKYELNSYVNVIKNTAEDAIHNFEDNSIDLLHIDGNHSEEQSFKDTVLYFPKVKSGGIIIFDDVEWVDGGKNTTNKAVEYLKKECIVVTKVKDMQNYITTDFIVFQKK